MSETNLPPEQWRPLFERIGVEFGYRPLANRIEMDHTRLRRLLRGAGTSVDAVQKVADAFGVSPQTVRELRGESPESAVEPFTLPDEAGRLTDGERAVIRSMVRALLNARDGHDESDSTEEQGTPSTPSKGQKNNVRALKPRNQAPDVDDDDDLPPAITEADAARIEPGYVKSGDRSENHPNE